MNNSITEQNAASSAVSPIASSLQAVLDLYEGELGDLKFPDLDQAVLQEAALIVHEKAEAQARAEAALLSAREALQESQEALLHRCQRAMAYARVYAEDNAELLARLEGIELPRSGRSRSSRSARPSASSPTTSTRTSRSPSCSSRCSATTPPTARRAPCSPWCPTLTSSRSRPRFSSSSTAAARCKAIAFKRRSAR